VLGELFAPLNIELVFAKHRSDDSVIIDLSLAPLSGSRHIFRKLNPFLVVKLRPDRDVCLLSFWINELVNDNWRDRLEGVRYE
jgi:hypothetical protein